MCLAFLCLIPCIVTVFREVHTIAIIILFVIDIFDVITVLLVIAVFGVITLLFAIAVFGVITVFRVMAVLTLAAVPGNALLRLCPFLRLLRQ